MRNGQRRDVLFLLCLVSRGFDVTKKKEFFALKVSGPFPLLDPVQKALEAELGEAGMRKEVGRAQMVVNAMVPMGFDLYAPEMKLWYACNLVLRLVASGWVPPPVEVVQDLAQRMYTLATQLTMAKAPSQDFQTSVAQLPEKLRERGMFAAA